MSKRGAMKQLTDRNWQDEDESEEAGRFKQANEETINKRVIKKAKRKGTASESTNTFKGFQGFGNPPATSSPLVASKTTFQGFGTLSGGVSGVPGSVEASLKKDDSSYMKQLKSLNQSVCDWIKKHITEDPFVDLSPVFKDYEKHLNTIENKFANKNNTNIIENEARSGESEEKTTSFASDIMPTTANGVSSKTIVKSETTTSEVEPDDIAKTDSQVRRAPETDAFYSIRCKLFFKRENSWAELGVGMLSLKKVNEKIQVLMRNDTAIGKILLNIFLTQDTPISRSGKNNILLISVPNPAVFLKESDGDNTKPVSYLVRVKTTENADELMEQMKTNC